MTAKGPGYRTVSLHEWHLVGPDGLPLQHRTIQVVRALRPGLASYTYRFDRSEATVHSVRGATPSEPYDDAIAGLTAVDLRFPHPLALNETASFEYETHFRWGSVPPPRFRRAARWPVQHIDIRLTFSPERLPAEVQWCVWDGFADDAVLRAAERVELDADHSVQRFVEELEGHTIGFTWEWPPGLEPVVDGVGAAAG